MFKFSTSLKFMSNFFFSSEGVGIFCVHLVSLSHRVALTEGRQNWPFGLQLAGVKEWMTGFRAGILFADWTGRCGRKRGWAEAPAAVYPPSVPADSAGSAETEMWLLTGGRQTIIPWDFFLSFLFFSSQPDDGEGQAGSHAGLCLGCDSCLCDSLCVRSGR